MPQTNHLEHLRSIHVERTFPFVSLKIPHSYKKSNTLFYFWLFSIKCLINYCIQVCKLHIYALMRSKSYISGSSESSIHRLCFGCGALSISSPSSVWIASTAASVFLPSGRMISISSPTENLFLCVIFPRYPFLSPLSLVSSIIPR